MTLLNQGFQPSLSGKDVCYPADTTHTFIIRQDVIPPPNKHSVYKLSYCVLIAILFMYVAKLLKHEMKFAGLKL